MAQPKFIQRWSMAKLKHIHFTRTAPQPPPGTRQVQRHILFARWFKGLRAGDKIGQSRHELRNLARAYAAKEWRSAAPNRGVSQ